MSFHILNLKGYVGIIAIFLDRDSKLKRNAFLFWAYCVNLHL